MASLEILPIEPSGPVRGIVRPPGSKSITNRALVCAALAEGASRLVGALESDDTRVMIEAIARLGMAIDVDPTTVTVHGSGGAFEPPYHPNKPLELDVGNSGTTMRFLTAMLTVGRGEYRLDGKPRMRQRPISDLLAALGQLGANVTCEVETGCPPVRIQAAGLPGGSATLRGDVSSQFLSSLLFCLIQYNLCFS